ncbi:S8 family serine peptidase [Streptomyces sp. NPDC001351]|uniref:S8 family serine peptidase n=1 Tax=Streptomyces sp. NPDC001351 TaxID=3364564 RepID=UPI0036A212D0
MPGPTTAGVFAGRALVGAAALALTVAASVTTHPAGYRAAPAGSGSLRGSEWALSALRADQDWESSQGQGVTVAVIGTGVDASHPDLKGRVVKGADLADYATGNGTRDQGMAEVQGTHVAGIIAGTGRNYSGDGMYGLAPQARILPVRVYRNDAPVAAATAAGIRYAARQGAKVIDVAVSFPRPSEELRSAIEYAAQSDALVVAGAGDDGRTGNAASYPAAYPGVVAVAASDKRGDVWPDSHYGRDVALTAPGVDILTTARNEDYWTGSSSAYAASWVAASAALVRGEHPRWNVAQVIQRLTDTADRKAPPRYDVHHGYGVVDPAKALAGRASSQADTQNRITTRSSDTGPALVVAAVTGTLLVLTVIAWLLIRRRITPSDDD